MLERRSSSSIWPEAGRWTCQVSLSQIGPPAPTWSSINGSTNGETIVGTSQADTIFTGGGGIDVLTGGGGRDTFVYTGTDATLQISGLGINGNVTGYGQITDFAAGATAASSELLGFSARTVGFSFSNNNSTLRLHTGETIKSHTISNGIISFNDGFGIQSLTTLGDVAAATQYMSFNDWGDAGATLAFTATLVGVSHTFIYTQTSIVSGLNNAAMVDLVNVSATGIVSNGATMSVLDQTAPTAPSITSIAENGGGGINAGEASNGTPVVVSLSGTGAISSDTLTINWGGQTVTYTLPAATSRGQRDGDGAGRDDHGAGRRHVRRDGPADRCGGQRQRQLDGDLGNGRHGGADGAVDHLDRGERRRRHQRRRGLERHAGGGRPDGHRGGGGRHADRQLGRPDGHLHAPGGRHLGQQRDGDGAGRDDHGAGPRHVQRDGPADRRGGQCRRQLDGHPGDGRHGGADGAVDHLDRRRTAAAASTPARPRTARRWWSA